MSILKRSLKLRRQPVNTLLSGCRSKSFAWLTFLGFWLGTLGSGGCGEVAKPAISPAASQVSSYFGGPFTVTGSAVTISASTFDHSANHIAVSGFVINQATEVPVNIIDGTFASAPTGFFGISESFATTSSGVLTPQNPSLTGAWAVEIPGGGALANLLSVNTTSTPASTRAAPIAMAQNTDCPNFPGAAEFVYVTVPSVGVTADTANYGVVVITTQGSAVTFKAQAFLAGPELGPLSTVTGGCSETNLCALTAYPLNSFGTSSNLELISMGNSGLLVSSSNHVVAGGGAFGGGTGVIGVRVLSSPVDVSLLASQQYDGLIFSPRNTAQQPGYDITVLASSFGNHAATSPACSALQASLAANNGKGARTVPFLPSGNSLYGGEFRTQSANGSIVNDPTGASGSENCDLAIDLGPEDSQTNGLFHYATVFVGSTFPPFSDSNPWSCSGPCAVSFPAAAVVGQVQGKYVIFVTARATSSPPAQLPDQSGSFSAQPVGLYLFQKM